jgi:ABC-type amino acid transport substrate-binding protein
MTKHTSWFRFFALSLITLSIAACGDDGILPRSTPTFPPLPPSPTTAPAPPDASTAARIRLRGYLLVGVRYDDAPFGIVDENGDLMGFDVDLAREFALRWLGDAEAVRFAQVTNASAGEQMQNGQVDLIIAALPAHQSLARDVAFSAPYYFDGLSLLVHAPELFTNTLPINGPGDLGGAAVGVVEESDTETPLLRAAGSSPTIVYYPNYYAAVTGLENRVLAAVVGPRRTLERLASAKLTLTPTFTRHPYVIGLPHGDGPLRDLVNTTLMEVLNDGAFARLFQQWFPDQALPDLETWTGTGRWTFGGLGDTLAPAPNTIQDIEARGYLIVGLSDNRLPFADFDANGVARGFEVELARTLAARWLGDVAAIQFVPHTEESGMIALQAGQIDLLAAALPHTLPRDDELDFSQTIYQDGIGLLVNAGAGIARLADLNGATVAAPADGVTAEAVQRAAAQAGIVVSVQSVGDVNTALSGVAAGTYRAYAGWRVDLLNLAYANSGFVVLDERLTRRPIALGLRQGDAEFRDLVDLTLQALAVEGRYAALYDDWFGSDPPFALQVWPGSPYRSLKLNRQPVAASTP